MERKTLRTIWLYAMVFLYFGAGVNHFINPGFYVKIMPSYIPYHEVCVSVSGICEMLFAVLLIPTKTRQLAALLIIAMLIVFFVVHIQMIIDLWGTNGILFWVAILRLPLQFILIRWAHRYAKNYNKKPSA